MSYCFCERWDTYEINREKSLSSKIAWHERHSRYFKIENEDLLIMIADFLMDNLGSQTSIRNVANKLTSGIYLTN